MPVSFLSLAARTLDWLIPRTCGACKTALAPKEPLFCRSCEPSPTGAGFPGWLDDLPVFALGAYEPPLSQAVQNLKYAGRTDLARPLAYRQQRAECFSLFPNPIVLVPVPLHVGRLRQRGYNQAALLARCLAQVSRRHCDPGILVRARSTDRQATLGREERLLNLQFSIECSRPPVEPVVLVDDVLTTGATLKECARALRQRGAKVAGAVVVCRAHHRPP